MLEKLKALYESNSPLVITPQEYQDLCKEVFELGDGAALWDDLILNYRYLGEEVIVKEAEVI